MAIPSGTVTFLFTDVEGSTRLWEADPEAMRRNLAEHDSILRQEIETEGGYIFTTAGDAFAAAFPDAPSALSCAIEIQRRLARHAWDGVGLKVRLALHTAHAEERDGDYFGPALNRVARLLSAGHGGQILTSAATRTLITELPDVGFDDLGEHRLKDLEHPERVYQVRAEGLEASFPALRTLEARPNNLPSSIAPFIGRTSEIQIVEKLIASNRLVTITGAGGAGKTRTAIEVAARQIDRYPDGVWMVELAPITDPDLIPSEMLGQLKLSSPFGRPPLQSLTAQLTERKMLVLLDNCEHLIEEVASIAKAILTAAPEVRVLATSRGPLGITGEAVRMLPTMETDASHPAASDSVRLFLDRAPATIDLKSGDLDTVVRICQQLDGLPLAIELAASRLRTMSLGDLEQHLENRFRILKGGDRTELPHHRTLLATLEWSYELLSEDAQELYRRLSVFAGSFDLDAAQAVGASESFDPADILDLIDELVSQSLLFLDLDHATTRYRMLESMRQHGTSLLATHGETASAHSALLTWAAGLAREASPKLQSAEQQQWIDRLVLDIDSLRVALKWALEHDPVTGLTLTAPLSTFWWIHGADRSGVSSYRYTSYQSEGAQWAKAMLEAAGDEAPAKLRARAQMALGGLLQVRLGEFEDALVRLADAQALFQELDDARGEGWTSFYSGIAGWGIFPNDRVISCFATALDKLREAGDGVGVGLSELLLGFALYFFGRSQEAVPHFEAFYTLAERYPSPALVGHAADTKGMVAAFEDKDLDPNLFATAIDAFLDLGHFGCLAHTVESMAIWQQSRGHPEEAGHLLGMAQGIRDGLGMVTPPYEQRAHLVEEKGLSEFDPDLRAEVFERGRTMGTEELIDHLRQLIAIRSDEA